MFYHSLVSDWNHGNAHFLRGVVTELRSRGHDVRVYEPQAGWSRENLRSQHGHAPIQNFYAAYPGLDSLRYDLKTLDLDQALAETDLVIVHEWNDPQLVQCLGKHRATSGKYQLLFHDTHHRSVSDREQMAVYDLSHYDGVLAYGRIIRDLYLQFGWAQRAWTWHEAADTRIFRPIPESETVGDLVWIGNWGDEERTAELYEFLVEPVKVLNLKARVHGVRYPEPAIADLATAGIEYAGWLPNYQVPQVLAQFQVTVHIPRRPYVKALPGIPTIRVFEALACGIPLVSTPWQDVEGLFTPGEDFLIALTGEEMQHHLTTLLQDRQMAQELAAHGRQTILNRHTCAHRVDELLAIYQELNQCQQGELPSFSQSGREPQKEVTA
jgi:spore maturation protein CgeB